MNFNGPSLICPKPKSAEPISKPRKLLTAYKVTDMNQRTVKKKAASKSRLTRLPNESREVLEGATRPLDKMLKRGGQV